MHSGSSLPPTLDAVSPHSEDLYLQLLQRALLGELLPERPLLPIQGGPMPLRMMNKVLIDRGFMIARPDDFDAEARTNGLDWPAVADSMIGRKRMENIRACVESVLADNVPGDLIETGVWRGGASIYMRGVLAAHAEKGRRVFVADSFAGLPAPDAERYPADADYDLSQFDVLAVSEERVRTNFARYGLLDDQVVFVRGWFKDTLPSLGHNTWAVVRLDGDLYESTMDALVSLYPGLSPGGYLIVDDYEIPPCQAAIVDYRNAHGIEEPIVRIDSSSAYWRKTVV
jgi:O-methyltransferase